MRIKQIKGAGHIEVKRRRDLLVPDSYRFVDIKPGVERLIRELLTRNEEFAVSGGTIRRDIRRFPEGLVQVLQYVNQEFPNDAFVIPTFPPAEYPEGAVG